MKLETLGWVSKRLRKSKIGPSKVKFGQAEPGLLSDCSCFVSLRNFKRRIKAVTVGIQVERCHLTLKARKGFSLKKFHSPNFLLFSSWPSHRFVGPFVLLTDRNYL